jgi:hypothetical protein
MEEEQDYSEVFEPIKVDSDAISWEVFSKVKEIDECETDEEGFEYCIVKPEYSKEIKDLDGQEVTLMGYMFPLDDDTNQKLFLFGPYPLSCPFHYHVNPAMIVEVTSEDGIEFTYDPIKIKGTFEVEYNQETGIFYYLRN